jgi:hypothetical protein
LSAGGLRPTHPVILLKLRNSSESQRTRPLNRSQPQKLSFGSGS